MPLTVGGGIRDFTDHTGKKYSALQVASEYFRSGADKVSIGSEAVFAAEEYVRTGVRKRRRRGRYGIGVGVGVGTNEGTASRVRNV